MQHRYVPDLGDFSKFAVIDALSGKGQDRTTLIWYLVNPHEVGDHENNDGKHTTYLDEDRQGYARCHPELYKRFQAIHRTGEKHVGVYEKHAVLPNVSYFSDPLSYAGLPLGQRVSERSAWLDRALQVVTAAKLVVLDPDNGLVPDRLSLRSQSAVKYASLDECKAFYAEGTRTLIVYQHAHRQGSASEQAANALARLSKHLDVSREHTFALRFHRGTTRFYLVVPGVESEQAIRDRAEELISSEWGVSGHFSLIP